MLALLAAEKAKVAGLALIAGAGRPLHEVLRFQLIERQTTTPEFREETLRILNVLRDDREIGSVAPQFESLFRPSVRPFLRSVINIDPARLVALRTEPVLVVGGGKDIQVLRGDFDMLANARPARTTTLWVDELTHLMKPSLPCDESPYSVYQDPERPISSAFVDGLTQWLASLVPN